MGVWKAIGAICVGNMLSGGKLLDGSKGGIGYAWFFLFIIIFFPFWLIYKIIQLLFFRKK